MTVNSQRHTFRLPASGIEALSPVQLQIARLYSTGMSSGEIASQMGMTRGAVCNHRGRLLVKLKLGHQRQLADLPGLAA